MDQPIVIAVCGPTASGKTSLAIDIAKHFQTEIISFDSRQFYKELKIGAAPPSPEELEQVPHHFIQHLHISEDYNAGQYERDAIKTLETLHQKHQIVVAVGGSGMYLKALEQGFDPLPSATENLRENLNNRFEKEGLAPLLKELKSVDPDYYDIVDKHNHIRIIRALEVIQGTGKPYSQQRKNEVKQRPFKVIKVGIDYPREALYDRINLRVDLMMEKGLLEEVKSLVPFKSYNALQTVGYREFFPYFDGEYDLSFAIQEVKKFSRRYAKRQMTWFRKDPKITWFNPHQEKEVISFLQDHLAS